MRRTLKTSIARLLRPCLRRTAGLLEAWRRQWAYSLLSARLRKPVDASVVVLGAPEVHGSGAIELGRNLYLYREIHLETQGPGRIVVGDDVVLSRGVHIVSHASVEIGDGTMIGEYTSLRDANHRHGGSAGPLRLSGHAAAPIKIGANVWIGRGATILSGVEIGDGALVAANAVVCRSVPAGARVGGVPARPLPEASTDGERHRHLRSVS